MRVALVALCPPRGAIADLVRQLIDHRTAVTGSDRVEFVPVVPKDLLTGSHPPGTIALPYRDGRPLPSIAWARALRAVHALDVDAALLYSQNIANLPVVAALRRRLPLAYWWHEPEPRAQVGGLRQRSYDLHDGVLRRRASVALVACPRLADAATARGLEAVVVDLPALDGFASSDGDDQRVGRERDGFVFFGRIEQYKGLDVLAEAIEILLAEGVAPTFRIMGAGDPAAACPRLFALASVHPATVQIDNNFHEPDAIGRVTAHSRALVLPYLSGTGTTSVAIAAASGTPTIASDVGCFSHLIGDGHSGLLVPFADAPALAAAIKRIQLDHELASRLSQGASERYRERFAPEVAIASLHDALREKLRMCGSESPARETELNG